MTNKKETLAIAFDATIAANARKAMRSDAAKRAAATRAANKAARDAASLDSDSVTPDSESRGVALYVAPCDALATVDASDASDNASAPTLADMFDALRESHDQNARLRYVFERLCGETSAQLKTLKWFELNLKTGETEKSDAFFASALALGVTSFDFMNKSRGNAAESSRFDLNAIKKIYAMFRAVMTASLDALEKPCRSIVRNMARCESLGVAVTREHVTALFDASHEPRRDRGLPLGAYALNECAYTRGTASTQRGSSLSALLICGVISESKVTRVLTLNRDNAIAQLALASV